MTESDKPLSRRGFLKLGFLSTVSIVLAACGGPKPDSTPTTLVVLPPKDLHLPELTNEELQSVMRTTVADYNSALETNIDVEKAVNAIVLVPTLGEFQEIIQDIEPGYVLQDETLRPAVTVDKKIYVYKESIDYLTRDLPNTPDGQGGKKEFIEFILAHELAHWSAVEYTSQELHAVVFGKMFANTDELKDKKIEIYGVWGAGIRATLDGRIIKVFHGVEEAEATLLGNYVMENRQGERFLAEYPPSYVPGQLDLLEDLVSHINPEDEDSTIKTLAQLRNQENGREAWSHLVAQTFGISESDELLYSMSIAFAIDQADRNLYLDLIKPRPQPVIFKLPESIVQASSMPQYRRKSIGKYTTTLKPQDLAELLFRQARADTRQKERAAV